MPGTTRYSATFDRTYEEDEKADPATNGSRRSRSQSWQANVGMGSARPYTPLGHYNNSRPSQRSSSTDSGGTKGAEQIPTRTTSKTVVKTHNNPFQFVKVGSCPLYRKPEEQLKVVKEEKKPPEALKEEEEEWQTNLDSWKSRRRKMSEDIFRRQEEIRQFETEEQSTQALAASKKIKTFSEMVESRAHRGRTMSLCLISSPLDLQQWEIDNQNKNRVFSEESEENSAVNSEDEGGNEKRFQKNSNGNGTQTARNGSAKNKINKLFELGENCSPLKDGIYIDSGLESISSSHRTGDTPDSCSDFSQDSGSSIDCDSPRASGLLHGINLLEEYNSKSLHHSDSSDSFSNMKTSTPDALKKHVNGQASKSLPTNGNKTPLLDGIQNFSSNNDCASNAELLDKEHFSRKTENSTESSMSELSTDDALENSARSGSKHEHSIESENEVFVDDFEELNTNLCSSSNQDTVKVSDVNMEAQKKKILDCSDSTTLSTVDSAKSDIGVSSASRMNKSSNKEIKDNTKSENNPNSKSQMLKVMLPLNEANTSAKSESHSEEKENKSDAIKKENKVKLRKKKPTAKIVSVEISNQSADLPSDTKETSVENAMVEETVNIVFQSPSLKSTSQKPSTSNTKTLPSSSGKVTLTDVLPVEQIAEEMENLILQQLEEEERAKELSSKVLPISAASFDMAPSRKVEPPKEKPPPPPNTEPETQKVPSLKRINSTKRIKKEIHKRRSNFLGIENADEALMCDDSLAPPPNALEQILKAEMELDRESMKRLESAAAERLKFEEKDIIQKEKEIIATLETEEMQKHFVVNKDSIDNSTDENRIHKLKKERKAVENEKVLAETQILRLSEEKQLRDREEYIRKQEEDNKSSAELSSPLLSDAANVLNVQKSSITSSLSTETKPIVSLSEIGEGNTVSISTSQVLDNNGEKTAATAKPAVPPKPVKKKEAIRKERERLRQEQETLQKEREEHRLKLIKEQGPLKSSHKPNAPVCRLGPTPPAKPSYAPKLTSSNNSQPSARENVIFTSQSYHGAQNGISSRNGCVDPMPPVVSKQKPVPSQKKSIQNDSNGPQKVPLVKKTSHDSSPESKYNQNHWLIQEAEMRRIAELKERQHSQTHLAGDEVCSNSRLPNAAPKQDKLWSYAQPSVVSQKPSEKVYGVYKHAPQPPAKPSRVVPLERPEQILSISGRKRCSHCNEELGRGAAMIIESLQLYYHIQCFQCCVCQAQLGNGSCGTDVRVRNNKLHCQNCYSNDEAGLKFSQV